MSGAVGKNCRHASVTDEDSPCSPCRVLRITSSKNEIHREPCSVPQHKMKRCKSCGFVDSCPISKQNMGNVKIPIFLIFFYQLGKHGLQHPIKAFHLAVPLWVICNCFVFGSFPKACRFPESFHSGGWHLGCYEVQWVLQTDK